MTIEIRGMQEVEAFLKTLPDEVSTHMLYGALRGAALPINREAKANIQRMFGNSARYTGTLHEQVVSAKNRKTTLATQVDVKLRKVSKKRKGSKLILTRAGRAVFKRWGDDPYYGRFLEFGTSNMRAKPFLMPAVEAMSGESVKRFREVMQKRVAKWCKTNGVTWRPGG